MKRATTPTNPSRVPADERERGFNVYIGGANEERIEVRLTVKREELIVKRDMFNWRQWRTTSLQM